MTNIYERYTNATNYELPPNSSANYKGSSPAREKKLIESYANELRGKVTTREGLEAIALNAEMKLATILDDSTFVKGMRQLKAIQLILTEMSGLIIGE